MLLGWSTVHICEYHMIDLDQSRAGILRSGVMTLDIFLPQGKKYTAQKQKKSIGPRRSV